MANKVTGAPGLADPRPSENNSPGEEATRNMSTGKATRAALRGLGMDQQHTNTTGKGDKLDTLLGSKRDRDRSGFENLLGTNGSPSSDNSGTRTSPLSNTFEDGQKDQTEDGTAGGGAKHRHRHLGT